MNIKDRIVKEIIKYPECEAIRYYIDITNEFCNLFGNVVKQVKIELDEYFGLEYEDEDGLKKIEEDMYEMAKDTFHYLEKYLEEGKIELYGMNTYITFFNDVTLKIWNCDAGGIKKV